MSFPCVEINLKKIKHNTEHLVNLCTNNGIEVMAVTKGVCGLADVAKTLIKGGAKMLGESRIQNIISLKQSGINVPIYLIRIPMLSEVADVVQWADGSLNSEIKVITALSEEACSFGKNHKVLLMVDVGDLREGVLPENVIDTVGEIIDLPGIEFEGIGTNLGCYGGVMASYENMKVLVDLAKDIEKKYGFKIKTLSGGNSSTLSLLKSGGLASGINQFRLGESILLGNNPSTSRPLPGTYQDTIILKTEVIETKTKPSYPTGKIGKDAFGNIPVFEDKGPMRRAIVALGKQDCIIKDLTPIDRNIQILGASSDHLLLDVTQSSNIDVGSIIEFNLSYGALLSLMTSKYVTKYSI
ncbi:MAG TPA: alanine/ornithine racemase family PLP-dependent enzyme [Thermoanaerobacterales bacterium]|nr:alanine/ornithine racemase family PLP-dependent enzyme [Thermoanaerobacterales bacterium]